MIGQHRRVDSSVSKPSAISSNSCSTQTPEEQHSPASFSPGLHANVIMDTSLSAQMTSLNMNSSLMDVNHPKAGETGPRYAAIVKSGEFEADKFFYPRVLNAQIHPLISSFFSLGNERIIARYTHLNPLVNEDKLRQILSYQPKYFSWAGCDLFNVTDALGHRQMVVVETNSCPSGQKSMPLLQDNDEHGGYGIVMEHAFKHALESADPSLGALAVVYDKNPMEASGYASVMADEMNESVYLVEYFERDINPPVKWIDRVMHVRDQNEQWHPIRACFRYVTQKPWNRFPLCSRTIVLNSIVSCLAGGRNKMMAARAYEFFNAELETEQAGLQIRVPETIRNVSLNEIPLFIDSMGGQAVIKVPYSNAGQGVFTITNKEELNNFLSMSHHYDKFIVQSLVGNASWSSMTRHGKFYHVGTIPNKKCHTYVSDLRVMISSGEKGFQPVAIYARRARKPLAKYLDQEDSATSWEMLGTNLSVNLSASVPSASKSDHDLWTTETQRLLLMDRKDFNQLGLGVDDLCDAYVQTVLSVIAIDKLCARLMTPTAERPYIAHEERKDEQGTQKFDFELFKALNPDEVLLNEILL